MIIEKLQLLAVIGLVVCCLIPFIESDGRVLRKVIICSLLFLMFLIFS